MPKFDLKSAAHLAAGAAETTAKVAQKAAPVVGDVVRKAAPSAVRAVKTAVPAVKSAAQEAAPLIAEEARKMAPVVARGARQAAPIAKEVAVSVGKSVAEMGKITAAATKRGFDFANDARRSANAKTDHVVNGRARILPYGAENEEDVLDVEGVAPRGSDTESA